jgi:adenosine deaminase CECR1
MAGKSDMTLHGLRQLVEWSIDHSCMEPDLMKEVRESWEKMWDDFCQRIVSGDFTIQDEDAKLQADGVGAVEEPAAAVLPPV